jgi:(p)ppGpp synthase/HD superfamily hydrolase
MMLTRRFAEAFAYANELHSGQVRKGSGAPYVAHLLAVTALVLEHGGDEDEAIAALLHDAVEDQGGLPILEVIRHRFGDEVADIVEAASDATVVPKPPWRARKERFLARIGEAGRSAALVIAADKLHNVRSILDDYGREVGRIWSLFRGGRDGTLWYYRSVLESLRLKAPSALIDALEKAVCELEGLVREREG